VDTELAHGRCNCQASERILHIVLMTECGATQPIKVDVEIGESEEGVVAYSLEDPEATRSWRSARDTRASARARILRDPVASTVRSRTCVRLT